jgi:hypothetical protein
MSTWKVSHQPKHNYLLAPGSEAILYRQFGDRWYVAQGQLGRSYTKDFYRQHGFDFETRWEAMAHAQALAQRQFISPLQIIADPGGASE